MMFTKSLFALAAAFVASAIDYEREDGVLVLTDDNLATAIESIPFILVEFYAPWCGHCKNLAPEYAAAAGELADREDVELAKVDATENTESATKYGVSGYPTLKFFKNGSEAEYTGGRVTAEIVSWVIKKTGPSVVDVASTEALEKLKEENDVVLVIFAADKSDENKDFVQFTKFADGNDDVVSVVVTDAEVAKGLELEENSVVLFKAFDEGRVNFTGDKITKSVLNSFVAPHMLPSVIEFSDDIVGRLFGGELKEHILYFRTDAATAEDTAVLAEYRNVANAHKGELLFVAVDLNNEANGRIAEFFGITKDDTPVVRIINISGQPLKFSPGSEFAFNEAGFESFVASYLKGELKPTLNTEDVAADWDAENVKVIVGKNFKEVALNEATNTFLMAHAPWCGHCKSLTPVLEELADHFADDEAVVIAKMDATKNEVEEFSVQGFPTLKFFPSGSSEMVDFDGGRDLEALIEFVNANRGDKSEEVKEDAAPVVEEDEKDEL